MEGQVIRWGILGAGNIAGRFADSLAGVKGCELFAISCRSKDKAEGFAKKHPAKRAYGSHEDLLNDSQVDAVYLALPHGLHKEWAIKALDAKKAVLCEKPAALCADDMRMIAEAAEKNGVLFMEAMKTRFVPAYRRIRNLINDGVVGNVSGVDVSLCNLFHFEAMPATYHTQKGQGGCLLDEGIYCASWLEDFLPDRCTLTGIYGDIKDGIDYHVDAFLDFDGKKGRLECAFDRSKPRQAVITGEKGSITVDELHRPQAFTVSVEGEEPVHEEIPYDRDDFYSEICHFAECMRKKQNQSDIMPHRASIRCASILDVIRGGFTCTEKTLGEVKKQEEELVFEDFNSETALVLGNECARLALHYDKDVGIRIVRESDGMVLLQYMMDEKSERNIGFMEGKRNAVLKSGHSSLRMYIEHEVEGRWEEYADGKENVLLCGGAFPLLVNGKHAATIMASGLHEGKDHELIVRAVSNVLGKEVGMHTAITI